MSCGVGSRRGSAPGLLWLGCRPAAAASNRPLAWELPYAAGAALNHPHPQKKLNLKKSLFQRGLSKAGETSFTLRQMPLIIIPVF